MLKTISALLFGSTPATNDVDPRRAIVLALLDIYKRYGVYIGGRLEYADLVKEWPNAGFRRSDLEAGLDDALTWGLLELNNGPGESTVTLLSIEIPIEEKDPLVKRLSVQASDRSLQIKRSGSHMSDALTRWSGSNRRRSVVH